MYVDMPCFQLQTALFEGLLSQCDTILLITLAISETGREENKYIHQDRY